MTPIAVILILISALVHAGWNLLGKQENPSAAFFLVANTLGGLCLSSVLVFYGRILPLFPKPVWALLVLTGLFQAVYYAALAGAYRRGDLSITYPLARSSPVIVVTIVTLILGRGDQVSTQCIWGILAVVAGCFLLPMRRFKDFRIDNYLNFAALLALVAAFGTAGYSILDDEALRRLRHLPDLPAVGWQIAALYAFCEAITGSLWLGAFVLLRREGRTALRNVLRKRVWYAARAGVAIYLTYTLVLVSMAFVSNVSYVVAFRQTSVPLGAMLGVFVLKEPRHVPKFVGVAILFLGLVLVGTG